MSDKIINFYEKLNIKDSKLPKNWNKYHIMHNSMILALGGTGTGNTICLICLSLCSLHKALCLIT